LLSAAALLLNESSEVKFSFRGAAVDTFIGAFFHPRQNPLDRSTACRTLIGFQLSSQLIEVLGVHEGKKELAPVPTATRQGLDVF
jgi:hypothetical protein